MPDHFGPLQQSIRESNAALVRAHQGMVEALRSMVQAHEAMVEAQNGIIAALDASIQAHEEHEDLQETVHRLEGLVAELLKRRNGEAS